MIWLTTIAVLFWTLALAIGWAVYRNGPGGAAILRTGSVGCRTPLFARLTDLSSIETPCEAEAFLLVQAARAGGPLTRERRAALEAQLRHGVACCEGHVERIVERMDALGRRQRNPEEAVERVARVLAKSANRAELLRVRSMMNSVARAEGGPTVNQFDIIDRFARIARI